MSDRLTERVLCLRCDGNGTVKIRHGVSVCPRCNGGCWEIQPQTQQRPCAGCAALREALLENMTEIRQQAGAHYAGCNCTFCSVIARSEAAIAPSQPDGTPKP